MSQYITIHSLTNSTAKYQTLSTSGTQANSAAITARRIMITTGNLAHHVQFNTSPWVTTANGFCIPANTSMMFNFTTGDKVGVITVGASSMSILDLD